MKTSDWALIILVAAVGIIVSFFLCNSLLGDPSENSVTYKTVEAASSTLTDPDPEVFNVNAINPTVEVYVGQ